MSAALIIWSVREGYGPYDDLATFTWSRTIERPAAYNRLPPYHAKYGWTCLDGHEDRGRFIGVYVLDMPYWRAGDPGLGPRNPLPSSVKRWYIYGVEPWIPLVPVIALWVCWSLLFVRHRVAHRWKGRGFDPS